MTVRRLKAKQRGPWCSFCSERAVHRSEGFRAFACDEHLPRLEARDATEMQDAAHETEAERSIPWV